MILRKCLNCKKDFYTYPSTIKIGSGKYCSPKCGYVSLTKSNIGKEHWNWTGDNVSYSSLHKWIKVHKGNPKFCEHYGKKGKITNKRWNIDWANKNHKYKRTIANWIGLCRKCHGKYDSRNRQC